MEIILGLLLLGFVHKDHDVVVRRRRAPRATRPSVRGTYASATFRAAERRRQLADDSYWVSTGRLERTIRCCQPSSREASGVHIGGFTIDQEEL